MKCLCHTFHLDPKINTMKTSTLLPCLALGALLALSACDREDSKKDMSDDEIASTVENSLASGMGGATMSVDQSARTAANYNVPAYCGATRDTTINVNGPQSRYILNTVWTATVNCTGSIPTSIGYTLSGSSLYNGSNIDLEAILGGAATLTGLSGSGNYVLDGQLTRVGSGSLTTERRTKEFSSELYFDFDGLNISKTAYTILSGSATVTLNGAVVDGNDYNRTGNLVFNGDGTATLTLDNGAVFTINL